LVNAVTLEVTPQQAEQIDLARSVGSLSLVLRSQVDTGHINTTGASMDDLFKQPAVDKTSPARAVSSRTNERPEIIRGAIKTLD
jgi:pilus assembly protein CpaB